MNYGRTGPDRTGLGYLPAGLCVSVVAEVVCDPAVDGGQRDFGLLAGLHGHADERGVGIGRLDLRVAPVVHLHRRARLDREARCGERGEPRRRRGGSLAAGGGGAARVPRHPGGRRRVPGRRAGRRVGPGSEEAEPPEEQVVVGGRALRAGTGQPLRVGAQDGEVLQPVEAGEAVIQGGRTGTGGLVQPPLPEPVGADWAR